MKLNITCRDATRLTLLAEERRLGPVEWATLRAHLLICAACPRFVKQVRLMRRSMSAWRAYRDEAGGDAGENADKPLGDDPGR